MTSALVAVFGGSAHATGLPARARPPVVGLLGSDDHYLGLEQANGVGAITVAVSWDDAEPAPGTFGGAYLRAVSAEIDTIRSTGMEAVLDPGLQYPPAWVFALPGGTRFVNQYGAAFTGTLASGNDVANAVTDPSVRAAEAGYLTWLGSGVARGSIVAVRQGGGPLGELRYPSPDYHRNTNSFWAYDTSTQALLPASVRGWLPGTGSPEQAQTFLDAYNSALDGFGSWLNAQVRADFATNELVMLPGWGERPGVAAPEIASRLTLTLPEFNQGLDWTDLLPALPDPLHSVAYTTYLDAPSFGTTPQDEDPASFIASLVRGTALRLGGENTGNGTPADMECSLVRAALLHYVIVQWMDEAQLLAADAGRDDHGPTMWQLGAEWRLLFGGGDGPDPPANAPETPIPVLLPVLAVGIIGVGALARRRRGRRMDGLPAGGSRPGGPV